MRGIADGMAKVYYRHSENTHTCYGVYNTNWYIYLYGDYTKSTKGARCHASANTKGARCHVAAKNRWCSLP